MPLKLGRHGSFKMSMYGVTQNGVYHQFILEEFQNFLLNVDICLRLWGNDDVGHKMSCGKYHVEGTGKGRVTITHHKLGPFHN